MDQIENKIVGPMHAAAPPMHVATPPMHVVAPPMDVDVAIVAKEVVVAIGTHATVAKHLSADVVGTLWLCT